MTSDINGTVVAIQGNPVEAETLGSAQDGYVLTWHEADDQWEAKPSVGLQSETFISSGSWTCPANVYNVSLVGFGGGGGGAAQGNPGSTNDEASGAGGGGSMQYSTVVQVEPGTVYTITIGAGGSGGSGTGSAGANGSHTSFGSLAIFSGAQGGFGAVDGTGRGGGSVIGTYSSNFAPNFVGQLTSPPGYGGDATAINNGNSSIGVASCQGFSGGTVGVYSSPYNGGGGGGAGPNGNGAAGGNANNAGVAGNGASAVNNSGSGGGGAGSGSSSGGSGGNGGSGQLIVSWVGAS